MQQFVLLCNIHHRADEPPRAAILADRLKRVADPARAPIGFEDPILDSIVGTSLDRTGAGDSHTGAVFGVNRVEPDESSYVRITFPDNSAEAVEQVAIEVHGSARRGIPDGGQGTQRHHHLKSLTRARRLVGLRNSRSKTT